MSSRKTLREVHLVEYELGLSTGERILVAEADPGLHPGIAAGVVLAACESVVARVPRVTREVADCAKLGDDAGLKAAMKAQPAGALLKVKNHVCSQAGDCAMFTKNCSARNVKGQRGLFPECWEYEPEADAGDLDPDARGLGTAVVHAWRDGRYVLLVVG